MAIGRKQLGEILVEREIISKAQLEEALEKRDGYPLGPALVKMGLATEREVVDASAELLSIERFDLSSFEVDHAAVALIEEDHARKNRILPIAFDGETLIAATTYTTGVFATDDLRIMTGYEVRPVLVLESELDVAITRYCSGDFIEEVMEGVGESELEAVSEAENEDAPVVQLVNLLLTQAVRDRANDIHIEPQDKDIRVRFRVDGVLREIMRCPKKVQAGLISRLKILANMDIAQRRAPQDGRFGLTIDGQAIDFRVASIPAVHGEKVVLRLLERKNVLLNLDDLGVAPEPLKALRTSLSKPYGAILVTGPTGSGKTTTLYACLNILNSSERNVITVEDPVEYRLAGLSQVQVNAKAGLTFSAALRSILRHDPDVVMIGEIRDAETALIAVESALTGHLVLSTLHTNDAPSSITRLIEMGIEPFLIASALDCIIGQRLARRLCVHCREPYEPDLELLEHLRLPLDDLPDRLYRPKGCKMCGETGYRGRIGLYEVLSVDDEIERLAVERASAEDIYRAALESGMRPLRLDGFDKVKQGIISIDDLLRVTI